MPFYIKATTAGGTFIDNATPYSDLSSEVCTELRDRTLIDAWVDDHDGKRRAGLADIKKYCGISN